MASVKRGIRVIKSQLPISGKYPVFQNSLVPLGYHNSITCNHASPFIISAGAAGEIGYSKTPFWAADDCFYFDCCENLDGRFLYYALQRQQAFVKTKVRYASVPRLSRSVVESLIIPCPPIEDQKRIVAILDRFDALCNDLTSGLPAEIEARKKQYEYYWDKLLAFREAAR